MNKHKSLKGLIYRYRMLGFDYPVVAFNSHHGCHTLEVCGPCGQWKMIKGNSPYACIVGALKWAKANWRIIQRERQHLISSFPKRKR